MSVFYPQPANTTSPLANTGSGGAPTQDQQILNQSKFLTYSNDGLFFSLPTVTLFYGGRNYSASTTATLAIPDEPSGTVPQYVVKFGITARSLVVTDGGSGHVVGDRYILPPSASTDLGDNQAEIRVASVDSNGAVTGYALVKKGSDFTNAGFDTPVFMDKRTRLTGKIAYSDRTRVDASFSFVPDKFTISEVLVYDSGSGYLRRREPRYLVFNDPLGTGSGALATASQTSVLAVNYDARPITEIIADGPSKKSAYGFSTRDRSPVDLSRAKATLGRAVITHNKYLA